MIQKLLLMLLHLPKLKLKLLHPLKPKLLHLPRPKPPQLLKQTLLLPLMQLLQQTPKR